MFDFLVHVVFENGLALLIGISLDTLTGTSQRPPTLLRRVVNGLHALQQAAGLQSYGLLVLGVAPAPSSTAVT